MADAKAGVGGSSGRGSGSDGDGDGDCGSATRVAESPARTIDSHDSTTGSLATIVDRSLSHGEGAPSGADRSPTASQRTISDGRGRAEAKEQPQSLASDAQSHIYSSPVYVLRSDEKPLLKSGGAAPPIANGDGPPDGDSDDLKKPKIISHEEFQKQLQLAAVSRAATIDSRISKKQRLPPELIRIKDGHDSSCLAKLQPQQWKAMQKGNAASLFPLQLALGSIQLLLAISLVALGSLLLVREGSLARAGCGLWTGLFAAITGSLGVVSMRKTQTACLALSRVCIATSTLALAISGVGLSRDINHMPEQLQFDVAKANEKISASAGLIFTLFLHFLVSLVSVYRCAINMCARSQHRDLSEVFIKANNGLTLDPKWIGHSSKTLSLPSGEKVQDNSEKFVTMWMYAAPIKNSPLAPSVQKLTPPSNPLVLIPASTGCNALLPQQKLLPNASTTSLLMPPPARGRLYRARTFSQLRPGSMVSMTHPGTNSLLGTYRTCKSTRSADINSQRRRRRAAASSCDRSSRATKAGSGQRQRRKSATDVVDGKAFVYTGLDRVIADSFLARQEQTQTGSHVDYSSSSSASEQCNGAQAPPPMSASAKIESSAITV